jgi:hypothetical protein
MSGTSSSGLVAVHVAQPAAGRDHWHQTPSIGDVDWTKHGVEPRWLGMETSACAAAINPSIFHNHGADELQRFLAGSKGRDEVAVLISTIRDDEQRSSFFGSGGNIALPGMTGFIAGRRLGNGAHVSLAAGASGADRDLGMRLRSSRPQEAPWWSLSLHGTSTEPGWRETTHRAPLGRLEPILVDGLGDPVVAVWVSDDEDQRWYVVPDESSWGTVLDWLVGHALPEFAPDALRRVRAPSFREPSLETARERIAREALEEMQARHLAERTTLETELATAEAAADPVRHGLLFGSGDELEVATETILRDAGFEVLVLDEKYGTVSADLLATHNGDRRLVEVKSAGGRASEALVGALLRHLLTWPQIEPDLPVTDGVLIVNDQHKLAPAERAADVYSRSEFVDSLPVTVLSTRALYELWRNEAFDAIRSAVLTTPAST